MRLRVRKPHGFDRVSHLFNERVNQELSSGEPYIVGVSFSSQVPARLAPKLAGKSRIEIGMAMDEELRAMHTHLGTDEAWLYATSAE